MKRLWITVGLLLALAAPALGGKRADMDFDPVAEAKRLSEELHKLAGRDAWTGVERTYQKLAALGREHILAEDHWLAALAAENAGNTWVAYQRMLIVARMDPASEAVQRMATYREDYGRLTVRRVEATAIALKPKMTPFRPDLRRSQEFAADLLEETGTFDGMLPLGEYQVGPYPFTIEPTLEPVVIQRKPEDGMSSH